MDYLAPYWIYAFMCVNAFSRTFKDGIYLLNFTPTASQEETYISIMLIIIMTL